MGQTSSSSSTKYQRAETETVNDPELDALFDITDLKDRDYGYENIVFEGGGAKTFSYSAALQVLSDVGILQNIKRIAGASGGAVAAALLAVGYTPDEIQTKFKDTMNDVSDARFGYLSLIPNLFKSFGWHPGCRALSSLENALEEKTGNGKITFRELYDSYNKELCIVATNVSAMTPEYFHPKTTPEVSIAEAVRMSVSIPAFMAPYEHRSTSGKVGLFVDGGVLCNFPIHTFDGWFLSMDKKDTFFQKLGGDEPPFGVINSRTLGVIVYAADEVDIMKLNVHGTLHEKIKRPNTSLSRARCAKIDEALANIDRKSRVLGAARKVMAKFREHDIDQSSTLDMKELECVMESPDESTKQAFATLFGEEFSYDVVRKELDTDGDKEITFEELMDFLERKENVSFNEYAGSVPTVDIKSLAEFLSALTDTWQVNGARRFIEDNDKSRTIGIFTDYIKALDLNMEDEDLDYLDKQGKLATINFLRKVIDRRKP